MRIQSDRRLAISNAARAALPVVVAASAAMLPALRASAATLTYDADTTAPANDGAGVWDTSTTNWYNGTADVVWPNTTGDTAIFGVGGTGGTVAVGSVNVGTITFNPTVTTPYTLNSAVAGNTITLGSGITDNTTVGNPTINAVIAGSNGLAFSGTGTATFVLGGNNTYSGITTSGTLGRLQANTATALGASAGATATTLGTDYTVVNTNGTVVVPVSTNEAFALNGTGQSNAGAIRINGSPTFGSLIQLQSNAFILNNGGGAPVFNGNVDTQTFAFQVNTFSGAPTTTGGIIQTPTNAVTFNGAIIGTGSFTLQSSGGPVLLNGANTYTGTTNVTGVLGGTGSLASSATTVSGTVTGGNYNTVGTLTFAKALTVSGSDVADLTSTASDTLAVGTNLTLGAASILKLQGTTGLASYTLATYAGTLTGTFSSVLFNGVAGLPSGYTLNYGTGANSAITLVNPALAPEPATLGAIVGGATVLVRRRRRHA